MLMYDQLATYYDALVKDEEATAAWVSFVNKYAYGNTFLEVASGSGEITLALADQGYHMTAGDLSVKMLQRAQAKDHSEKVEWHCFDMRDLRQFTVYDSILCFCDSINYLIECEDWRLFFQEAYAHLKENGVLLFDMHTKDRLTEFAEDYCEAGYINQTAYEWTISAEGDLLYHNFVFYDDGAKPSLEQHVQRVMSSDWVTACLKEIGFQVKIVTDFTKPGCQSGEKYFYICKKVSKGEKR